MDIKRQDFSLHDTYKAYFIGVDVSNLRKKKLIFLHHLTVVSGHVVSGGSIWAYSLEPDLSNISNTGNKVSKFMLYSKRKGM